MILPMSETRKSLMWSQCVGGKYTFMMGAKTAMKIATRKNADHAGALKSGF